MAKERALTLEALRVMDAIDRRGSFAAAADELGRVPSALSYTMQKLEEELDVVLFDRSGHRTKFTNVGRMLLERGRVLLEAADKLTTDAEALSRGWETHLTIVTEALVPTPDLFPLIEKLATKSNTQLSIITEVLAGAWERLEQGRADIVVAPDMHFRSSSEINSRKLYSVLSVYVAAPDHPIHQEPEPLSEVTRVKYRGVAVADTARERPVLTVQLLDKQPRLTVSTIEDKRQALLAGLGVATMPYPLVEKDIAEGRLRVVSPEYTNEIGHLSWPGDGTVWRSEVLVSALRSPSCLPADSDEDAPPASGRSRKISRKRVSDRAEAIIAFGAALAVKDSGSPASR
ncbi:LysR-family transcriptional regulator YhaJ [Klebsiella pneumoniae]|uniref:LysR-family transcriptional regulator YhaJ n=23 Tax=Enterobacteriaceae TaxID=543 RepID=A0A3S4KGU2_KLEPN|nr:LysR-family transcriptional regulator YhaJ [Klebsiella pneumoniae]